AAQRNSWPISAPPKAMTSRPGPGITSRIAPPTTRTSPSNTDATRVHALPPRFRASYRRMKRCPEGAFSKAFQALFHFSSTLRKTMRERCPPGRQALFRARCFQEPAQRFGRRRGLLFENPVPGVLEHDDRDVAADELRLLAEFLSQRLVAADRQHRHRKAGP